MWLTGFLPSNWVSMLTDIAFWGGVVITLIGFILTSVPFISKYRVGIQILGILLLVLGVYTKGGYAERQVWEARVAKLEKEIAVAEEKARQANEKLSEAVKKQTENIEAKTEVIIKEVPKYITPDIDKVCKIPPQTVDQFNKAAKGDFE